MNDDKLYAKYSEWKQWTGEPDVRLYAERYRMEMARAGVRPGSSLLELGFGDGAFLDWARASGYHVYGAELQKGLVERAEGRGHRVVLGTIAEARNKFDTNFDAVIAFDVLEHLDTQTIARTLRESYSALRPGGVLIACFPNGASPFGGYYQNSDVTHQTWLTHRSLEQLGLEAGFRLLGAYNLARPVFGRRPYLAPFKLGAKLLRFLIEHFIGFAYFGLRVPLDPAITAVLKKDTKGNHAG